MSWQERLELIEEELEVYPLWQRLLFFLLILGLVGYFGYTMFGEPLIEEIQTEQEHLGKIESSMQKNRAPFYLRQIQKLKQDNMLLQSAIEQMREKKNTILEQLHQDRVFFLTNENFAQLLDNILNESKKRDLILEQILITPKNEPYLGKIYEKKELAIRGEGEFLNIVKFLRSIENSEVLLRIDNLSIETNGSMPRFSFLLKLYGGAV